MKTVSQNLLPAADFYDDVSGFYGKMIDFERNLQLRINAYKNIFEKVGTAADLGCGIGLDSIALAMNGHVVTAFDISPEMIEETNKNAVKFNVEIKTVLSPIESIPAGFKNNFQNIVCAGNTIAHLNTSRLKKTLKKIHGLLKPDGKLFLHILNYEMIRKQNKRINNVTVREGMAIIRFYDFFDGYLNFNILSFALNKPKDFRLITTKHFPHSKKEIILFLNSAGFSKIKFYGDLEENSFSTFESKDMFISVSK